jgi:hypothetical protein
MPPKAARGRAPTVTPTYQMVHVEDLSGGLDLRRSPTLIGVDRSRVLMNFSLGSPGELVVRPGFSAFTTGSLGADPYRGARRVYLDSTTFTLTAHGGIVRRPGESGSPSTAVEYSTIHSSNPVFFPYDRLLVAVFDGANRPRKSTGSTTWTQMGIDASTSVGSSASSLSSGSLSTSEFEFTFAYKNRGTGHQSNVSTVLSTRRLTGATGAMHLEIPNSADAQVDAIVVYARNKTAGETVQRKASSFAAQGGASSTTRIVSSAWSANEEAPTNHDVPGALRFAVYWKNRWWAADSVVGNRIYFTEIFQNESWPTLFYVDIPFERGDEITALVPLGDTLLVFGQSKVFLITGQTSLDFEVKLSAGAQAGALGPRATASIENGVVHAAAEGVFIYDGFSDKLLSHDIEPGWRDLIKNSASTALALIDMVYHFPYKELRIAVPRLYPRAAPGEWVIDLNRTREAQTPAWADTDRPIGGYVLWDGDEPTQGVRGRLVSWASTGGRLFKESTGTTANSSDFTAEYEGSHFATGFNRARLIDLRGEYEPHSGALTGEVVVDNVSQGQVSLTIGTGLATYDSTVVYGTATYGVAGRRQFFTMLPLSAEGRTAWVKMSYTGREAFRVFTYAVGIVPEMAPRGFSE